LYEEELPASLITEYFQTGNPMRRAVGIHGRVRHQIPEAQPHGDDLVLFEVAML
jgi:hypothetical protein